MFENFSNCCLYRYISVRDKLVSTEKIIVTIHDCLVFTVITIKNDRFLCQIRRIAMGHNLRNVRSIHKDPRHFDTQISCRYHVFVLNSPQESNQVEEEDIKLDIYLMNGKKFQVNVKNTDSTDHVMQVP